MSNPWIRIAALLLPLAIGGCGGGGGGSGGAGGPGTSDAPATVGVLLTDAPTGRWDEAIATITSVRLLGDDGQVVLFSGSQTLDLLELGDFSELFAVSEDVPAGVYDKIRLQLSDLVLNDLDPDTGALLESVRPQLVGNGKIDLNPRDPFLVGPGDVVFVELDFDMEKSLKITETGNGKLIIRPVVFVDIRTERPDGRLSRIHGEITAIDTDTGEFRLCQTDFASRWDDDDDDDAPSFDDGHCVTVVADEATGIFGADGLPQDFLDLAIGEEATVIGRLRAVLDDEDDDGDDDNFFALDAFVIEEGPLGTFQRVRGAVASAVDVATDRFGLAVEAGQGIDTAAPLPVQLYAQSRIFNRAGDELARGDIVVDRGALVDGVLVVGDDDHLRSPFVILADAIVPEVTLEGAVVGVDTAAGTLTVNDGTMDRCVEAAGAEIFLVDDSDGFSSERGELGDLVAGQNVAVFGEEGVDGCLIADTILAEL